MKKLIISVLTALILVAVMTVPAIAADEQTATASVSVNEVISISISDANSDGVNFGSLTQGDTDKPDIAQSTTNSSIPAVTITLEPETNVSCNVTIKGTDFDTTIPVGSAKWAVDAYDNTKYALTASFALVKGDVTPDSDVNIWHFIDIPSSAAGGTFQSSFSYKAINASP